MPVTPSPESSNQTPNPNQGLNGTHDAEGARKLTRKERRAEMNRLVGLLDGNKDHPEKSAHDAEAGLPKPGKQTGEGAAQNIPSSPGRAAPDDFEDEDESPQERAPKRRGAKRSLAEFAEEAGLDPDELLSLAVETGIEGDEPKTVKEALEQLRTLHKESASVQERVDDFEERRSRDQNDLYVAQQRFLGAFERVKWLIPPDKLEEAFAEEAQSYQAEKAKNERLLIEWFPEWRNDAVRNSVKEELTELIKGYGWNAGDMDRIKDAPVIKLLYDFNALKKRFARLKEKFQVENPGNQPVSTRAAPKRSTFQSAKAMADAGDKRGAIDKLVDKIR